MKDQLSSVSPIGVVGAFPLQFLRLSSILADRGWSVNLIDYADGTMARNLRDHRVRIISYADHAPVFVPANAILVLQTMTPWSIFPGLRVEPTMQVLFWTCHPFNLIPTVPLLSSIIQRGAGMGSFAVRVILPAHWRNLKRFLRKLIEKKSIVFMDIGTARNTSAYLRERLMEPTLVPVPAPAVRETSTSGKRVVGTTLRIGWVGRIADFKYSILSHTLKRLNEIAPKIDRVLSVEIVGSGDCLSRLQADVTNLKNLTVRILGEKSPDEVAEFLKCNIDLLFAMGTSALEGASYYVPTILLDFSYRSVSAGYNFRWLHEVVGYSLGEFIGREHIGSGDDGLVGRVLEAISDQDRLGVEAQSYVWRNHSIEKVTDRLEVALLETNATWGDLVSLGVLRKGLIYRFFKYLQSI